MILLASSSEINYIVEVAIIYLFVDKKIIFFLTKKGLATGVGENKKVCKSNFIFFLKPQNRRSADP